ncbi:hypothetical protein ACFCXT_02610 [Streptomyces vinaceus]|uniref:hypothetical protein n=1 Tax=Streptomyces vinaceus TaxID=1960 RepID=UPI0035E0421A
MQEEKDTPVSTFPDNRRDLVEPLDADQLERIKATHRGFLYQHLYTVGCLLRLADSGGELLSVERDEDLEVVLPSRWLYLQVKTRKDALRWGDIRDSVNRFEDVRTEPTCGERSGVPALYFISNAPPGPRLLARIRETGWPADVHLLWPGGPQGPDTWLPPPGREVVDMLDWVASEAGTVPFGSLSPRTLVWKLAALVQYACTGAQGQSFAATDLPTLYEQFVADLQDFPAAPESYRAQPGEPDLAAATRLQLVVGFSGAGKTTWAAHAALHCPVPVTYFDVAGMPAESVAGSVSRALAARHLCSTGERAVSLPHGSGLDVLRAVHQHLAEAGISFTVVFDNIHLLPSDVLRSLVEALPTARLTLLGQSWPERPVVESLLGTVSEVLPGWDADTIAAAFASEGCTVDYPTARRVLRITGGLPLYVLNSALLTANVYARDGSAFCEALETQTHLAPTAQELILEKTFAQLTETARTVSGLLALAEVPLTSTELQRLAHTVGLPGAADSSRAVRTLTMHGLTQITTEGRVTLHDAARPLAQLQAEGLTAQAVHSVLYALGTLLEGDREPARLARWMRALADTEQTDTLLALSEQEGFYEAGYPHALRAVLARVAEDAGVGASPRFDAYSALATWAVTEGDWDEYARHLDAMEALLKSSPDDFGVRDWSLLTTRRLALHGREGNRVSLDKALAEGLARVPAPSRFERGLRYGYAHGLFQAGAFEEAGQVVMEVAESYVEHLALTPEDVFTRPIDQLRVMCHESDHPDDYKRLADCLSTYVLTCRKLGRGSGPWAIPARRLYTVAGAWRSAIRSGQDVVDTYVEHGQFADALALLDTGLLPIAAQFNLPEMVFGLRSQRAVVLAWSGDVSAARAEMADLSAYEATPDQTLDFQHQVRLIEEIAAQQNTSFT